jgi:PAS domain S-box-containing protein
MADTLGVTPDLGGRVYRLIFEKNPVPMLLVDSSSHEVLAANNAAEKCYGRTIKQLLCLSLSDLFHVEDWPSAMSHLDARFQATEAFKSQWRHLNSKGDVIDVLLDSEDVSVNGMPARIISVRDVTKETAANQSLYALSSHFDRTLQTIPEIFFILDFEGCFTFVNVRAEKLFQDKREALLGRFIGDCIPETWRAQHQRHYEEATGRNIAVIYSWHLPTTGRWYEVRIIPTESSVPVFIRDVTRKHFLEEKLRQVNHYLHTLTQVVSEAVISVDMHGDIQTFNGGAERMFGMSAAAAVGHTVEKLLPVRLRDAHIRQRIGFSNSAGTPRMMGLRLIKGLRSDGKEIDLEGSIAHAKVGDSQVFIAALQDVTARLAVDVERQETRTRLSNLARKLMLQEKELVKQVAQILHDQLGQTLAAIRVVHEAIGATRRGKNEAEAERLELKLAGLIDQAIGEVRMVLVELHPPLLEEFGLAAALDNELRDRAKQTMLMKFELKVAPDVASTRWSAAIEYAVFMIAREAIENAIRHSEGDTVVINLSGDLSHLTLEVVDNGKGFGMAQDAKVGHLGMAGIQERAKSIGAKVAVLPANSGGTCVAVRWEDPQ